MSEATDALIDRLESLPSRDGLFNPHATAGHDLPAAHDEVGRAADAVRTANLRAYLARQIDDGADVLLCGEAPGYQGCRFTGIAFTSEVEVQRGLPALEGTRLLPTADAHQRALMREPSARAVWSALERSTRPVVLWNTVPLHPHEPGVPLTNRRPTSEEVALGRDALETVLALVRPRMVAAIGRVAEAALADMGVEATYIRHPAYGGVAAFNEGLEAVGIVAPPPPPPQLPLFG